MNAQSKSQFKAITDGLVALLDHVNSRAGTGTTNTQGFDPEAYSKELKSIGSKLSKDFASLYFACKPPASFQDVATVLDELGRTATRLVSLFDAIPGSVGATLFREYQVRVADVLQNSVALVGQYTAIYCSQDVTTVGVNLEGLTGAIAAAVDRLAQIPLDNRAAVLRKWNVEVVGLVQDAYEELRESIEDSLEEASDICGGDGGNNSSDSEEYFLCGSEADFDLKIPQQILPLARQGLKLLYLTLCACKKIMVSSINGCRDLNDETITWLDQLLEVGADVPPQVDTLVSALSECEDANSDAAEARICVEYRELALRVAKMVGLAMKQTKSKQQE
ncbi:Cyclin-D1-binding protein 1, partial [Spiromyces aspiralis]